MVIAHRGASDRALENSPSAISLAVAGSADMIEFDVRLSSDGEAVVLHDARTGRTGRENIPVSESTAARLRRVRLKNGDPFPFLSDALDLVRGTVPIVVHVKVASGTEAVCRSLAAAGYRGRVILSSGLREECKAARALRPDLPCGLVTIRPSESDIAFCLRHGLLSIHPDRRRLSLLRIRKVKRAGLLLIPWTVDDPAEYLRLTGIGADGVFTNRFELLREVRKNSRI